MKQTLGYIKAKLGCTRGIGTIEVILIIFILVGVVVMFREKLFDMVDKYLSQLDPDIKNDLTK
ncbi:MULTISPECIES: Flp1 family type IVb pilin [unclassified Fusibacter]|uniref:Flp1 family type IVb pilin n=1 Tax=unclassified Fusibacter TaxID=2624464 RepID=UPI001013058D|nr:MULTISPECIES: Flp1 family type IVb pilin [unclassified Fusibacter]MCK8060822.1 hypothetical protein [Fusibacter sp. A2]NPE23118.1 hypothetical protein [Fusibacter sp. A1]RXV59790.1 hypothetical protein DWB64_14900 [Fusibacter sp. A1]